MTDFEKSLRRKRKMPAVQGRDLYVIACLETRRCKIGRANDVGQRFEAIQSCCPTTLIGYAHGPNLGWLEEVLHEVFAADRLHNEWFGSQTTARIAEVVRFQNRESFARFVEATRKRWVADCDRRSKRIDG